MRETSCSVLFQTRRRVHTPARQTGATCHASLERMCHFRSQPQPVPSLPDWPPPPSLLSSSRPIMYLHMRSSLARELARRDRTRCSQVSVFHIIVVSSASATRYGARRLRTTPQRLSTRPPIPAALLSSHRSNTKKFACAAASQRYAGTTSTYAGAVHVPG